MLLTRASKYRVMRSPRLAAMGVATLSGLIPTFLDPIITATTTRPGDERDKTQQIDCPVLSAGAGLGAF